jgi:peptidoglycan/xylan/chitin deacetylase (PgdA/CDA1 family)
LYYSGLAAEPVNGWLRRRVLSNRIVVLMYHELADDDMDIEAWMTVRASDFCRQVEFLQRQFSVVGLGEAMRRSASWDVGDRPLAVITFDDGDKGNADVLLPLTEKLGCPVTVFVATGHIVEQRGYWFERIVNAVQVNDPVTIDLRPHRLGTYEVNRTRGPANWLEIQRLLTDLKTLDPATREEVVSSMLASIPPVSRRKDCNILPMTVADVRALAASPLVTIGAHSHCHNILSQIPEAAVTESLRMSKTLLEEWTGQTVTDLAYPNGDCNDVVERCAIETGFRSGFTTERRAWARGDSVYRIPRIGVGRYDSFDQFKIKLVNGYRGFRSAVARV